MSRRISRRLVTGAAVLAGAIPAAAVGAPSAAAQTTPAPPVPPLTIDTGTRALGPGDLFLTPTVTTAPGATPQFATGAEIASPNGTPLWFHQAPAGDVDSDLRPQRLHGQQVLTFWEGTNFGGLSNGTDYIYNSKFQQIAAVHAGDGLATDGHEFLLTNSGKAWVLSYDTSTADLTSIGGPADQTVVDAHVQEIDVRTGKVLFSWNAADHVPYSQSEQPLPSSPSTPWDWFHINAVKLVSGGNLLISGRDTWTIYKVNGHSGRIIWQLGGKASTFNEVAAPGQQLNDAGEIFAWQHDPEQIGPNEYTVFDNESAGAGNTGQGSTNEFSNARVVTIKLNQRTKTATLVASDDNPAGQVASSQGNAERLPGGGELVGWGNLPEISEFDAAGKLVFDATFPTGVNTYRAYLLPWGAGGAHGRSTAPGRGIAGPRGVGGHSPSPGAGRGDSHPGSNGRGRRRGGINR